ncbi:MAG: hypothetical protein K2N01_04035 [Lachnospiraceae bacterium]|nr:hypothetical protein [Lachnospiraceae bacterium]
MFHRELKINFGELERAADALDCYVRTLTRLAEGLQMFKKAMGGGEGEAYEALMQEKRKVTEHITRELGAVTDTRGILCSYIRDMTAVISPDIWGQQMVVDRNDIWANMMTMEEKIMHLANIGYYARVSSWDIYTISPDQKTRKAEERYYKQVETVREDIVPAYYWRIQNLMAEVTRIYQDKIVVYENIDDEYQWIARDNYQKYTDSRDSYWDAKIMANQAMDDFGLGVIDGIWDMLVGAVVPGGSLAYTMAAGVTCAFCGKVGLEKPEWAGKQVEGLIKSQESMEKNPLLLAEGIAQGASDALEQKGICYCAGYIIGPILATKGITKGIEKLRVAYSARQASRALKAEEAAMRGADDLANPAVNSMDDVGKSAADIADDIANSADDVGRVAEGGTNAIKNNLANSIKDIREKMPNTNLAKRGNMAVADVDIPGIKDNFVAHSKINGDLDKGANVADFSYIKPDNERIFTTYVEDQYPRYHDTEAKILEDIASQIVDPSVGGTINLYSELPCCQSCSNIILEFRRMFPNIELNVFVK